jgi:hypothetical protein
MQAQEMYQDGVDIQSQKTNEQLDNEDEDAIMCQWDVECDLKPINFQTHPDIAGRKVAKG